MVTQLHVGFKVEDFEAWKEGYDADLEQRKEHGEISFQVFRNVDAPNVVTVLAMHESVEAVQGYMDSPELAEKMKAAGITDMGQMLIMEEVASDASGDVDAEAAGVVYMLHIGFKVEDYDKWQASFDASGEMRAAGGEGACQIFRDPDDANILTLLALEESIESARAYGASDELREAMAEAGMAEMGEILLLEEMDGGTH